VLYDDSAPREAPEAYAASRGVVSSEQYSSKKELRRALHGIMVANECVNINTEAALVRNDIAHELDTKQVAFSDLLSFPKVKNIQGKEVSLTFKWFLPPCVCERVWSLPRHGTPLHL
jgi:hypothetical protein